MNGKSPIKFVFFGTPDFAVGVLDELYRVGHMPCLVVTNPDRPKGRNGKSSPPPVKLWAQNHSCEVLQPTEINAAFINVLKSKEADLFVVAAYGFILPKELIYMPPRYTLNVHPSLLPKYRGATPIQSTILNNDRDVGVSIICIDEKMDHGPIIAEKKVGLNEWPIPAKQLESILASEGGKLLVANFEKWVMRAIEPRPQDHKNATFTKKIVKEDGALNFDDSPLANYLKYLAFDTWPGTYFFVQNGESKMRIRIKKAHFENDEFIIERVVPENKNEMSYEEFQRYFQY